ncbi:cytochrome c oxidase subunit II [Pedobacter montanisoli]|uniref:Cytochrome c oxidase subunit 2 n=1 Tax=Pedobacter montanisoli TaxID=2923277 RepID=A0ABS9ZVB4_9SPHI|nr:cytochrome c oxidase subunit II [Pedobacter montanisoli]MCJ0741254.1 cytochrome c oxidase subunit II [Pedobacter montanisoli]
MSLIKVIGNKAMAALAVIFTLFSSTAVFAQEAAAIAKPVDMEPVYRSTIFYVLLFLLACLFIAIVGKALKVYELTRETQGKSEGINWDLINAVLFVIFLIVGLYGVYFEYTVHGKMILPEAASEHGKKIDQMFEITLILTTIVFIATHIVMFVFTYIYRYNKARKAYYYPHNNMIERIWTIVPALVLTVLVLMGFLTWRSIFHKVEDPNNKPLSVEVTSSQFQWDIRYPGKDGIVGKKNYKLVTSTNNLGIDFNDRDSQDDLVADEIVLPVNKAVRFTLTSKDVIHSFYMPQFRVQLNTVPGMPTQFEFTPTITTDEMKAKTGDPNFHYVLLCSKICGTNHFNMQKVVRIVSEKEYEEWLTNQKPYLTDDLRKAFNLPVTAPAKPADSTATASVKPSAENQLALKK